MRVYCLRLRLWGLGLEVSRPGVYGFWVLGFKVSGFRLRIEDLRFRFKVGLARLRVVTEVW